MGSRVTVLDRPAWHRPLLGAAGYLGICLGPSVLVTGALWLYGALVGVDFDELAFFAAILVLRQANVFVVSTLYHRSAAHRAFRFHPVLEWPMRIWGWFFLGSGVRIWGVIHRPHHAKSDTVDDVHSPVKPGESLWTIPRQSVGVFRSVALDLEPWLRWSDGLPDDTMERFFEADLARTMGQGVGVRFPLVFASLTGMWLALGCSLPVALGAAAITLPGVVLNVLASTILLVNGIAHVCGYQNVAGIDHSMNVFPIDLFGWGEAHHNNHHAAPRSANFSRHWWEIDPGFWVLVALEKVGLVRDLRRS